MARGRLRPRLVSVVIPVRNGAPHLAEQLAALSAQRYRGRWELVVVDNGSTDGTRDILEGWRPHLPEIVVVDAGDRRGLNYARNRGAAAARGDLLVFCDADDVVAPGWLAALADAARGADLVAGTLDTQALNDDLARAWRPPVKSPLARKHGFLPHAPGGNCAVWRDVADAVGWDEIFAFGSSDIEFSWRVQLAGYTLTLAEHAVVHLRFRPSLRALTRQYFVYGKSDPQLYCRFRRDGMQRSSVRNAIRTWWSLLTSIGELRAEPGRGQWLRVAARCLGRVAGSARRRVVFL